MKIQVDARGMACPKPVIMTKKELDKLNEGTITAIVDNEVAKENISKLANSMGLSFTIDKKKDDEFYIHIIKEEAVSKVEESNVCTPDTFKDITIGIGSDKMGSGDIQLGKILMKSFIYTVRETTPYPATIVLFNSGVYLTCEGSEVLDDLLALEEEGVEIISCGTCLDFYHIKDKLAVGSISNMYTIYEKLRNSNNTINLG